MARDYEVLQPHNKDWMFIDPNCYYPGGYISYRHVISHALHSMLHNMRRDKNQIVLLASRLKNHWGRRLDYNDDSFIEMRFSATTISVIDHSKGCYPLIIEEDRIEAFQHSVDDVCFHINEIFDLIASYPTWCPELQNKLNEVYVLPRRS